MTEPLQILRAENEQLKELLSARTFERDGVIAERDRLQAAIESIRKDHEATVIRLTTEILALKRQLFGPKAERIKNAEAQQSRTLATSEFSRTTSCRRLFSGSRHR